MTKIYFYWKTDLSVERQDEIIRWVKSLTDNQYSMIKDLIDDALSGNDYNNSPDQ